MPQELKLPYIRLRVDYSGGYNVISTRVFNAHAEGRLANVKDFIMFFKKHGFAGPKDKKAREKS